jgi:hypothetical protein
VGYAAEEAAPSALHALVASAEGWLLLGVRADVLVDLDAHCR